MTLQQTIPFLIFSLVAAITPGPSNVMITATGSAAGIVRGLPCVVGAAAGMAALLFTAALGLGQLILGHPEILRVMNWCGAAFLLWLAWKIANAGRAGEAGTTRPVGFFGAAFFQRINPKGWLVAVSAAGTYMQPDSGSQLLQALVLPDCFSAWRFRAALSGSCSALPCRACSAMSGRRGYSTASWRWPLPPRW